MPRRCWLFLLALGVSTLVAALLLTFLPSGPRVHHELLLEAGSPLPPAVCFVDDPTLAPFYTSDTSSIDTLIPGVYAITLRIDDKEYAVSLKVVDTTPPVGSSVDGWTWLGDPVEAETFVSSTWDMTAVKTTYKVPPSFDRAGLQSVAVLLTDTSGNQTELAAKLTVERDAEAPVISGVKDIAVYVDDSVTYREGVTVTDNRDDQVTLQIDNTEVDLTRPGTYTVVYSATDAAGNRTETPATVKVSAKPRGYISEAELWAKVDEVLDRILEPDMTDLEKLREIFYYIRGHVRYVLYSVDKSSWVKAAYLGITHSRGDCFTIFTLSKAMLTRAGFETIPIHRVPASTRHYWNLVKYEGEWYHFDPLPNLTYYHYVCFLRTDAEIARFTRNNSANHRFYTFDHTGIPPTPTTPLDIKR